MTSAGLATTSSMTFMSMMGSRETVPNNISEARLQLGWVTHLEATSPGCKTWIPGDDDPGCPVDFEVIRFIDAEQPRLGVPYIYSSLPECGGCGKGVWHRLPTCVAKHYAYCFPESCNDPNTTTCDDRRLDPRWHENVLNLTAHLRPLVESGKVGALFLGDELVDHGVRSCLPSPRRALALVT